MTITLAWVRNNKDTTELLVASDSRLRSRGAIDQAQKIFRLDRGDCCLGFCGDAQVAYPLFVQVGSALNNYIRTRTLGTVVIIALAFSSIAMANLYVVALLPVIIFSLRFAP